jgi:sigma-B regulation protein RsbU (phosphoserine phosphatase)
MTEPADPCLGLDPQTVAELWRLAQREGGERAYVAKLLELLRAAERIAAVAVYAEQEGLFELVAQDGEAPFPPRVAGAEARKLLESRPSELEKLPGGLLALRDAVSMERSPGLRLLLAAHLRGLKVRQQLKRQRFEVNYRVVELEALYEVGLAIAATLDLGELSEVILLRAVSLLDARRGALYLRDRDCLRLERTVGGSATSELAEDSLAGLLAGTVGDGIRALPGVTHFLAVPIETESAVRGLLVVADKETRAGVGSFALADRRTLGLFANQAAIALENARLHRDALEKQRLEREMELAAAIQRRLLPKGVPEVPGYELYGWNRSALQVGGDYYDFLARPGGNLGFALGDVSGKGVPAALLVSTLHSSLRLLADHIATGPDFFARLNQHLIDSSAPNKFVTLFLGELETGSGTIAYLNAGHSPAFVVRASGAVEVLSAGGLPLGLLPHASFRMETLHLAPGDLLCLYSDGVTECAAPGDEEFGLARLAELVARHHAALPREIVEAIDQATVRFAAGLPQADDQTVVIVRRS